MSPNVVYLWVARGSVAGDVVKAHAPASKPLLVKVGVTQKRLGVKRVNEVARLYRFEPDLQAFEHRYDALKVEAALLRIGSPAKGLAGCGRTEFRFMSSEDVQIAKTIMGASKAPEPPPTARPSTRAPRFKNRRRGAYRPPAAAIEPKDEPTDGVEIFFLGLAVALVCVWLFN